MNALSFLKLTLTLQNLKPHLKKFPDPPDPDPQKHEYSEMSLINRCFLSFLFVYHLGQEHAQADWLVSRSNVVEIHIEGNTINNIIRLIQHSFTITLDLLLYCIINKQTYISI